MKTLITLTLTAAEGGDNGVKIPADGIAIFDPKNGQVNADGDLVSGDRIKATVTNGVLLDAEGNDGVWLEPGQYWASVTSVTSRVTKYVEVPESDVPILLTSLFELEAVPGWRLTEGVVDEVKQARDEAVAAVDGIGDDIEQTVTDLLLSGEIELPPGEQGPEGPQGPAGRDGAPGSDGASAYQVAVSAGFAGTEVEWLESLTGPEGPAGRDGIDGQDGKEGPQGPPGADGADGEEGPRGLQGIQGEPGVDGADGAPGADGKSAYQIALDEGFVGDEAAFLDSLVGPEGPQGPAGEDGAEGPRGEKGDPGEIPDLLVGNITDATPTGRNLMLAATEGAARNALGLQTGATSIAGSLDELNNGTQTNSRVWSPRNLAEYTDGKLDVSRVEAENYTLEKITTAKRNIADFTDRLTPLINIPARPEGSLWPQGIAVDDEQGVIYVCYTGYIDTQYNVRISRFDFDGNLIDFKSPRSADNNPDAPMTSSESIPFWWNAGKLYFLMATGTNGRGRLVYNFTDNTIGPIVETLGGYRGDFDGDFYVTSDSNDSTSGVSRLFYYDANAMKNGVETLVRTVRLQFRARRRKLQGLTTHEGVTVGLTGPSSEVPGIIAWSQNGNQVYSYEYDPVQFGELVNSVWPGTITDTASYHREPEGAATDSAGRLHFGSVINNGSSARFVVFRTGDPTQPQVMTRPDSETVDSDWQELVITNTTDFEPWAVGGRVEWRRIGAMVCIRGEVRTKTTDWSGKQLGTLAAFGRGVVPAIAVSQVQQGSGNGRYAFTLSSTGAVSLGRPDSSLNVANAWLNINVTYMTD